MMSLSQICLTVGGLYVALHLPLVLKPGAVCRLLLAFPRNNLAGIVLAVGSLVWAAWELNDMPLGMFDAYKSWLWILTPVVTILVLTIMSELLAVRALGGALMLAACPVLEVQRLHPSCWTWVPAGLAYVWVVVGMVLTLSPFRFRHLVERFCATDALTRVMGAGGIAVGGVLVALGLTVFKGG